MEGSAVRMTLRPTGSSAKRPIHVDHGQPMMRAQPPRAAPAASHPKWHVNMSTTRPKRSAEIGALLAVILNAARHDPHAPPVTGVVARCKDLASCVGIEAMHLRTDLELLEGVLGMHRAVNERGLSSTVAEVA